MERLVTSSGYEGVLSHRGIKPELVGRLGRCGHMYHLLCLLAMYNNGNKVSASLPWGHPPWSPFPGDAGEGGAAPDAPGTGAGRQPAVPHV